MILCLLMGLKYEDNIEYRIFFYRIQCFIQDGSFIYNVSPTTGSLIAYVHDYPLTTLQVLCLERTNQPLVRLFRHAYTKVHQSSHARHAPHVTPSG